MASEERDKALHYLISPQHGRRNLPVLHFWIGGKDHIEKYISLEELLELLNINYRDLWAKLLQLKNKVDTVFNNQLLLPTRNKYLPRAQHIDEIEDGLLKHKSNYLYKAVPGSDYVDYRNITEGQICIVPDTINDDEDKYISGSGVTLTDIKNTITQVNQNTTEIHNTKQEINEQITNVTQQLYSVTNNINTNLNNVINNINNINNNVTNITNNYTNVTENITNIQQTTEYNTTNISNLYNTVSNLYNECTTQLEVVNQDITNIDNSINNINLNLNTYFNLLNTVMQLQVEFDTRLEFDMSLVLNIQALVNVMQANIASLQVSITNVLAEITAIWNAIGSIEPSGGDCIAWAMGNDNLGLVWTT